MAGGGAPTPSTGGKKTVDFQLNMIPFIDLLSVLISFLLMTSMWVQISRIDVQQAPNTPGPPVDEPVDENKISIVIKKSGFAVTLSNHEVVDIALLQEAYDNRALSTVLARARSLDPVGQRVEVSSEDDVPYSALIGAMDACLQHGFTGIAVAGVDGP